MKSKRSKACEISQKVKEIVWNRDNHKCIYCDSRSNCYHIEDFDISDNVHAQIPAYSWLDE